MGFEVRLLVCRIANWCRKCIYLKPKLEKLAVDYYPRLQFYSVDVNAVSHKLIARAAGVTVIFSKLPHSFHSFLLLSQFYVQNVLIYLSVIKLNGFNNCT
ncbi:hypothetical protein P8452_01665 [Trifolium repens]|nr:hypothetical protein P8452_01665 [Trifolium repens]